MTSPLKVGKLRFDSPRALAKALRRQGAVEVSVDDERVEVAWDTSAGSEVYPIEPDGRVRNLEFDFYPDRRVA